MINKSITQTHRILQAAEQGQPGAADELIVAVYDELRRLAAHKMALERAGQTLQPTALVHEAWIRLRGAGNSKFQNRAQFFSAAAEAMRRILIDRARRKQAVRHGGGLQPVSLNEAEIASPCDPDEILEVNEALELLAKERPVEAELVKLRYFMGMTIDEAAQALEVAPRTAKYYWTHARAWLYQHISRARSR